MHGSLRLMRHRRFLPLFLAQFLGAFNDNLFKNATILLAVFEILHDPHQEQKFTAIASAIYILPFFLFSALGGQLADSVDKARLIRIVKLAEVAIMTIGAVGLLLGNIYVLLLVLFLMATHSSVFGPTKYAILPQHLEADEVLGGTSMVEAGTYVAILIGTMVAGVLSPMQAAAVVLVTAGFGVLAAWYVPSAPPEKGAPTIEEDFAELRESLDHLHKLPLLVRWLLDVPVTIWFILRSSWQIISTTMRVPRLYWTIVAISFFVAEVSILGVVFAPMVKNILGADNCVVTLMLMVFTIGVAVGAVLINWVLKGQVSARYAPYAALAMSFFLMVMYWTLAHWPPRTDPDLIEWRDFVVDLGAFVLFGELFLVSVAGGMFVVPLYAFLTTTVEKAEAARTVAANNIVSSGAGVFAVFMYFGIQRFLTIPQSYLLVAAIALASTWFVQQLHESCDANPLAAH
jgi:MFS family permease